MTIKEAAQDAILVQDACNLSGVAHSLTKAIEAVWASGAKSTDEVNRHPIVQMYLYKMVDLAAINGDPLPPHDFSSVYAECRRLAGA